MLALFPKCYFLRYVWKYTVNEFFNCIVVDHGMNVFSYKCLILWINWLNHVLFPVQEFYLHDSGWHSNLSTYQGSCNARQNFHYTRQVLSLASSHAWNLLDSKELGLLRLTPPTASWYGAFNKSVWGTSDMNDKWYMVCLKKCAIFGFR